MKILFLGSHEGSSPLLSYLMEQEKDVVNESQKVDLKTVTEIKPDFIISYNYRHIISKAIIERYKDNIINLHISLLPWNRGAHPNFWSFWDDTPKGITIHYIDEGIDTGDIIVQKDLIFNDVETLKSTYDRLQDEIQKLFIENWSAIKNRQNQRTPQRTPGSFHLSKDINKFWSKIEANGGWNISIYELKRLKSEFDM